MATTIKPNAGGITRRAKSVMKIKKHTGRAKVQFGSVVVQGPKVPKDIFAQNVKVGSESLKRAAKTVTRPGVKLQFRKGVPQFFVDSERQGFFVRRLDGKIEHGQVVGGKFVVVD